MGKSYSSREIIRRLRDDGWYLEATEGDHHQFKHPTKPGKVTVQHPKKDLGKYEIASIKRQAGLKF
jgi:predicted RNA binding protein YcfA (HicA-like mRNA interferase family)